MVTKREQMESSLFKRVKIIDSERKTIIGRVKVFETDYDNDEREASICILTDDGEGLCLLESDIDTIEIL